MRMTTKVGKTTETAIKQIVSQELQVKKVKIEK